MTAYKFRLVVTFDIPRAKSGDKRYKAVDDLLRSYGDVTRVFKQVRLVATNRPPTKLAPAISSIVSSSGSVLIVHAAKPYRFVLGNQHQKALTRPWISLWMKGAK
jgi:hypothetical protein